MRITRSFSVTTCRTRRRSSSSGSRSRADGRSWIGMSRSCGTLEDRRGPFAGGPPSAVFAVGQGVRDPGVDDQHGQAVRGGVERDVLGGAGPGVEQQHGAFPAGGGGGLVHRSAGHADEVVLGVLGDAGDGERVEGVPGQRGDGQHGGAFDGGGGGQAGAGGHLGVEHEVDRFDRVAGVLQRPDRAEQVARPPRGGGRARLEVFEGHGGELRRASGRTRRGSSSVSARPAARWARASMANGRTSPPL